MPIFKMEDGVSDIAVRYGHLLKPIRDITKNWDIDVAAELEAYLTELEEVTVTFDGGVTTMNFAEAAMLIQGSAGVYSRKVEYLYALVYQTLDLISSKKMSKPTQSGDDGEIDQSKNTIEEFLTLDDAKEGANVEMVEDLITESAPFNKSLSTIVPRTPMALTPFSEVERILNAPLFHQNGELIGNKMDFKMNTSCIHWSGALLLEPTNQIFLDLGRDGDGRARVSMGLQLNDDMEVGPHDVSADDVHDSPLPSSPPALSPVVNRSRQQKHGLTPFSRGRRDALEDDNEQGTHDKQVLDPHGETNNERRPFKKVSTQVLPPSLREEKKQTRKRRKSSTGSQLPSPSPVDLSQFLYHAFYSYSSQFPKSSFNAPSTAEFEAQFWSEQKRRKSLKSKQNIKLARLRKKSVIAEEEQLQDEGYIDYDPDAAPNNIEERVQLQDVNDDQVRQLFSNSQESVEPIAIDEHSIDMADHTSDDMTVVQNYEDLVRQYVQSTLMAAVSYAQETELSKRVREWEERIKPTLLKEEQAVAFDIHAYGSNIIQLLSDGQIEGKAEFKHFVQDQDASEVCRLFAASLQLANDSNVEISSEGSGEDSVNTMNLTLLSSVRSRDAITNYRAPSVQTRPSSSLEQFEHIEVNDEQENVHENKVAQPSTGKHRKKTKRRR